MQVLSKKLCMFSVRLVDICRIFKGDANSMTGKIGLNHTEFCTRQVRGPQIVQTFSLGVKPQTEKFLVLDEHLHTEYMYYFKKLCMFPVRLVDICRFL